MQKAPTAKKSHRPSSRTSLKVASFFGRHRDVDTIVLKPDGAGEVERALARCAGWQ